jgi:hypothetical protein
MGDVGLKLHAPPLPLQVVQRSVIYPDEEKNRSCYGFRDLAFNMCTIKQERTFTLFNVDVVTFWLINSTSTFGRTVALSK